MRFVRYEAAGGKPRVGLLENDQVHDIEAASGGRVSGGDTKAFFRLGKAAVDEIASTARKATGVPAKNVKLLAPIANPGKLIAVAGGYYSHAGEKLGPEAIPMLFANLRSNAGSSSWSRR